jgi:hypothetical protein
MLMGAKKRVRSQFQSLAQLTFHFNSCILPEDRPLEFPRTIPLYSYNLVVVLKVLEAIFPCFWRVVLAPAFKIQ